MTVIVSKSAALPETSSLFQLAEECGLRARIDAMFRGEKINITENRAVLHVALRAPKGASIVVDGENVVPQVHAVVDKMAVDEVKTPTLFDVLFHEQSASEKKDVPPALVGIRQIVQEREHLVFA